MQTPMFGRAAPGNRAGSVEPRSSARHRAGEDPTPKPNELAGAARSTSRATGLAGLAVLVLVAGNLGLPISGSHLAIDVLLLTIGYEMARSIRRAVRQSDWLAHYRHDMLTPLVPPLLLALALITGYWVIVAEIDVAGIKALLGAATMTLNFAFIFTDAQLPPLANLWLLAMICQLGLVAPTLVRFGRRRVGPEQRAAVLIGLAVGVALCRIGFLAVEPIRPVAVALNTLTRLDPWLIGLAIGLLPAAVLRRGRLATLAGPALALLVLAMVFGPDPDSRPVVSFGIMTTAVIVLTTMVLVGRIAAPPSAVTGPSRILRHAGLRWLGERAIGIYLWHNLFTISSASDSSSEIGIDSTSDWPGFALFALRLSLTLAAAGASHALVELPTRAALGWIGQGHVKEPRPEPILIENRHRGELDPWPEPPADELPPVGWPEPQPVGELDLGPEPDSGPELWADPWADQWPDQWSDPYGDPPPAFPAA